MNMAFGGFDVPVNTLQVISETIFRANLLAGAEHPIFSTNHLELQP